MSHSVRPMQSTGRNMNRRAEWSPRPRVGIMTYVHVERAGDLPLDNLVALVSPLASKLFLITGGDYRNDAHEMEIIRMKARRPSSLVSKILEQASAQMRISRILLKLRGEIDVLIFFGGRRTSITPCFCSIPAHKVYDCFNELGCPTRHTCDQGKRYSGAIWRTYQVAHPGDTRTAQLLLRR